VLSFDNYTIIFNCQNFSEETVTFSIRVLVTSHVVFMFLFFYVLSSQDSGVITASESA